MKRLSVFLVLVLMLVLTACDRREYEIALITDVGTINDKSFNQGSWEGVVKYAKESNKTYKYYQPKEKSHKEYLSNIDLAVKGGAKVIVTPGYYFETAVYEAQTKYPDVTFILVDGEPNDGNETNPKYETKENVYPILFAEEQAGFLAGYAAVKDGFRNLGFMGGMAVPAVVRFGYGFIQGAEYAAKELGLADQAVNIKYKYLNSFGPDAKINTEAASWYNAGTEVIFVAAGGAGSSVMSAAESVPGKYIIGVDIDQSGDSDTVITSAMKQLANSVYLALKSHYEGGESAIKKGQTTILDVTNDGVGLPQDFSRMRSFTSTDYNQILNKLKNDTEGIRTSIIKDVTKKISELGLQKVKVNEVSAGYGA